MNEKSKFVPLRDNQEGKKGSEEFGKSAIEKAQDETAFQKEITEQTKLKQEQLFYENNIKDVEDLRFKREEIKERQEALGKETYDWKNLKATEEAELQKQKAEVDSRSTEIDQREQNVTLREANVEIREQLVAKREELMTLVEQERKTNIEKQNSDDGLLKTNFAKITSLMGENAVIIAKAGFKRLGRRLWGELEEITVLSGDAKDGANTDRIIKCLREQVEVCNSQAVKMARNTGQYGTVKYNRIVDNLEVIYRLLPSLKPEYLPQDDT